MSVCFDGYDRNWKVYYQITDKFVQDLLWFAVNFSMVS